jgi:hypothetical protein
MIVKILLRLNYVIMQKLCQKKFFACLLLALLIGLCLQRLSAHAIDAGFTKLSHQEKVRLKVLFEKAIKIDHLGHVLFFSTKPACFFSIENTGSELALAWQTWKAKEHLFPHPNFIVYEEVCENKRYVYFINKQTLFSQLSNKEEILKKIFGQSFFIKDFIAKLEQKTFNSLIRKDHILLGILLGYGIESSLEYVKYITCDRYPIKELAGIHCAAEGKIEITQLGDGAMLCTFNSEVPIHPVSFVGDPDSEEVKTLKEIYSQELEKIEMIYQRKDLLRICLERLCH